jgi:hypothetical protein
MRFERGNTIDVKLRQTLLRLHYAVDRKRVEQLVRKKDPVFNLDRV